MDQRHRKSLAQNRQRICEAVALRDVEDCLKKQKIFNHLMWQDIMSLHDVFELLPTRGPEAYKKFIKALKNAGFYGEAKILEDEDLPDIIYRFSSKPKGVCLVINIFQFEDKKNCEDRIGSDSDALALVRFFKSIEYDVYHYSNLKAVDINSRVEEFAKTCAKYNIVILFLMSHGSHDEKGDYIYGTDGNLVYKDKIVEKLTNYRSPYLQGKPKIFFFIACRGNTKDFGVEPSEYADASPSDSKKIMKLRPSTDDLLVVHSTLPNHVSVRDDFGSWFCQDLLHYLENELYKNFDIQEILMMVNLRLEERVSISYGKQVLHIESMGFRKLYLCGVPSANQ